MCGIAGILSKTQQAANASAIAMSNAMPHRGPDADGIEVLPFGASWLGLAHRRLSIIDLSPLGRQPMWSVDGECVIVFNGEIYNYQRLKQDLRSKGCSFRSESDTEVILNGLHLYGADFLNRLEGMYAFAFFDKNKNTLLLGRDPIGIKPLYYYQDGDHFLFASEMKSILATGIPSRSVSRDSVEGYLGYGAIPQPNSVVDSIQMLPPGSILELHALSSRIEPKKSTWWTLPSVSYQGSVDEAISQTAEIMEQAVRDHLISDVPVGVFLSAGIDSTLIASIAHRYSSEVRAFTVALSGASFDDEVSIAKETADRIGIEHVAVTLSEKDAEEAAFRWLSSADQPSIDGLNTYVISQAVRQHGIKVALSGLGADELFGGYPSFTEVPKIATFLKATRWAPMPVRKLMARCIQRGATTEAIEKLRDMLSIQPVIGKLALHRRRLMSDRQLELLGYPKRANDPDSLRLPEASLHTFPLNGSNPGWTISKIESIYYQGNMLLRDSDANSMAHSLELRVPFLDQRLLNWIPTLPDSIRFPKNEPGKYLLRQAGRKYLDQIHLRRPKTGFTLPFSQWLLGPMRGMAEQSIQYLKDSGIVRAEGVNAIWQGFLEDRGTRSSTRAVALIALGAYLKQL